MAFSMHVVHSCKRNLTLTLLCISVKKVVIIICSDDSEMSQDEEGDLTRSVRLLLHEKGEILWWKRNKISPHQTRNPKRPLQYCRSKSLPERGGMAERSQMGIAKRQVNPNGSTLLLKTRLRHGAISYRDEDLNKTTEGWQPPKEIEDNLMKKWRSTNDAELLIYHENIDGRYRVVVNKESWITQVGDSLKERLQTVGASLAILGNKNTHPPKDTSDGMELD